MKNKYLGSICLTLAACIWGGMYVVSKVVLTVIPPLELVWIRYLVALVALVVLGLLSRQKWSIRKRDLPMVLAVGVIGYVISIAAQFIGTKMTSAQMGAVITSATPAFMVVFALFLLKEKMNGRKSLSVSLATVGVLLIVGVGDLGHFGQIGGLVLALAAVTWALMSVLVKRIPSEYSQLVVTTYAILIAAIVMTPIGIVQWHQMDLHRLSEPRIWGGVLYLGVVSTAGAFFLWNQGLQMVDAAKGSLYFFFQPLVGTLLGWLLLGERVGVPFWIGAVLILGGVFLVANEQEHREEPSVPNSGQGTYR